MHEAPAAGPPATGARSLANVIPPDNTSVSERISQASVATAVASAALLLLSPLCPPLGTVGLCTYLASIFTNSVVVPVVIAAEDRVLTHPGDYAKRKFVLQGQGLVVEHPPYLNVPN
jgi:hypothetical protein